MSIMGNLTGFSALQPDWNQDNPNRGDYIRNKPDLEQLLGQGSGALSRTGGTMEGDIGMAGNRITGLPEPLSDTEAVPKAYLQAYVQEAFLGGAW